MQSNLFGLIPSILAPIEAEFDDIFWPAYPRKVQKDDARKAFAKRRKKASLAAIMDLLATRKLEWARRKQISLTPHAARFLNAEDFPEPETKPQIEVHPSWNGSREKLEKEIGEQAFLVWFAPQEYRDGAIICQTLFQAHTISTKYAHIWRRVTGEEIIALPR